MGVFKRLAAGLQAASRRLAWLELAVCQLLIVAFAGLLLVNVVMRYAFSAPIYFAEELAVYILIWMAYLAIAATIARREMIALTFVVDAVPAPVGRLVRVLVDLAVLAICVVLVAASWRWLTSFAVAYEQALTLGMSKKPFYAVMPLFFLLACFHTLANLLADIALAGDGPGGAGEPGAQAEPAR